MVWKVRNKGAFIYEHGAHRYVTGNYKMVPNDVEEIPFFDTKTDLYTSVKLVHNYRNMSRAAKQFLLGDSVAEQYLLALLRLEYQHPSTMKSPIYLYIPLVS